MLKQVRSALKGVVAWFVIVLLILAFAAWGVPELRSFTQNSALRVGDANFSSNEILNEFNRAVTNRRLESEGGFSREDAIAAGLPDQIITSMATRSALEQEASSMGLVMPRAAVKEYLQEDSRFHNPRTGKFDNEVLASILRNYNFSVRQFEVQMRQDLLRQQLVDSISAGVPAPEPMIDGLLLREVEQRNITYLTVTDEMAGVPEEPTPDKLQTFYSENPELFTAPEFRTFTVLSLKSSDFTDGLDVDEDDLRELYEASRERLYEKPERRTIYQITFETEAEAVAAASALRQGKLFEQLAEEQGLSLGAVTFTEIEADDILDPSVSAAAFHPELEEGSVTDPVKSLFGWTVVQVVDVLPPSTQSFEEVRDELERQFLEQDTRKRVLEAVESIEMQRDTGALLADAAEEIGLTTVSYGPVDKFSFGPNGEVVADIPTEILTEAFLLEEGAESEAVDFEDRDGYFFVSVNEVTAPQIMPFESVAAEVESRWRRQERNQRIAHAVAEIQQTVEDGAALAEAAAPFNRAPITETITSKDAGDIFSEEIIIKIFSVGVGDIVTGPAGSGSARIVSVVNEIDFNRAAIGPGEEIAFQQFVGYQLDQELLDAYVTALRQDYGVETNVEQISQLFAEGQ